MDRRALAWAALEQVADWEAAFGAVAPHPALEPDPDRLAGAWDEFTRRMAGNFPFHHPRYAGQMLKPPHPVAVAAYLSAMCVNPNNHALDGGPVTSEMEREVVADLGAMFGFPSDALGHLTASGTIANLEALWIGRELAPGSVVLHGEGAHYTHERMAGVLGIRSEAIPSDADGRLDLDAVDARCAAGDVGTVVLTAGATGSGAVDAIDEALALRERHGVRLHVDAAYGGFFGLVADALPAPAAAAFAAIADCDSVVVDPHKHGLQPYGCGAVLLRDPSVGRFYKHDSPYTYFTSGELHLGEISLECSRAGAAAAALWLTLRALPLRGDEGLGPILRACLSAARALAGRIEAGDALTLHEPPVLDIVTYFPARDSMTAVDAASRATLAAGMAAEDPVFLSTLRLDRGPFSAAHPSIAADAEAAAVLRSVLMKPEHEPAVDWLHERVSALAAAA